MSQHIFDLQNKRNSLRETVDALYDVLKSHNVTMTTPLTVDGFPRADIDVHQIRSTRHQIIRLENDIEAVQKELEEAVMSHWQKDTQNGDGKETNGVSGGTTSTTNNTSVTTPTTTPITTPHKVPFATVGVVSEGSPAATAGLKTNDKIVRLGNVEATTPRIPQALPLAVVEGNPMDVVLLRGDDSHTLTLLPAKWEGNGLIGAALRLL
ncbi:putative 26S proteasome regulatory subunit p27 [Yarrowia sp. C11]|nr:putative 26S proteasome regulatory subunit p27 [Yarrowia sp. C11]KAG5370788.1 putative 26S proteasome regulatory subunit p27 [Yarrowia sp. E02]